MFPREEAFCNTDLREAWLKKNVVFPTEKTADVAVQPGSFAYDMKPLFQLYKLVGNFPVHVKDSGYAEFRLLCPLVLYTVLVQASMLVAGIFLGKERMEYVERERPDFGQVMMEATFLLTVLYIFLSAAASLPESKTKARYISSWTDYQIQYKVVVGKPLDLNLRWQMRAEVVVLVLLGSVVTSFPFVTLNDIKPWYGVPYLYCLLSCLLNTGLWRAKGLALVTAATRLTEELEQLLVTSEFSCADKIAEYRALWLKLGKLTEDVGNCMGFAYGIQVVGYFFEQVLAAYSLLSGLQEGFSKFNVVFAASFLTFSWLIFITCDTAQRATDEVGRSTQEKLQNLSLRLPKRSSESRQEVRFFIEAIAENPPKINFSGFVVVNRGLQTSFMSTMVTYLVVLIQFQISSESTANRNETCVEGDP